MANHRSVKEIFSKAVQLPPGDREAFVDRECGRDAALRARVEALLHRHAGAGAFLASPTKGGEDRLSVGDEAVIGRYTLRRRLGEGGFGVVYLAEQAHPVARQVALKIIKLGMDTARVIARFEAERQALAMMDHPGIAKVFDAGTTDAGRPYFVMELVHGVPITEYCDSKNLTTRERLDLFTQVCKAVQHAHLKGVIHQDIKPSNVLVALVDDRGAPKIIDFGIAKATSARLTEKTLFAEHRTMIGTPEYMSPEQAALNSDDIDTRSDVYSLGVLLYELLAGTTPFDGKRLRSAAFGEMQRIIREEPPPKPSTRLNSLAAEGPGFQEGGRDDGEASSRATSAAAIARLRATSTATLVKAIRGDLDWIVMKCLEKDRTRRYESASELARDIGRSLDGHPVLAGPPSAAYRVRKFATRHRGPVAAAAAVFTALVLGLAGTLWKAGEARRESVLARDAEAQQRRLAELEATARKVAEEKTDEANRARAAEVAAREAIEYQAYVANVEAAGAAAYSWRFVRARARLDACPERLRGWEWNWLMAAAENSAVELRGHTHEVTAAAFSPDGMRVVTASRDRTARVWDARTGADVAELNGHLGQVNAAVFSPDGTRIVTASVDHTARVWDAYTGASVAELKGHTHGVWSAAFSTDGTQMVTASRDHTARVWDATTGVSAAELKGHTDAVFSAIFSPDGTRVATASWDKTVRLWDPRSSACEAELMGHTQLVVSVAFSPDGRRLVTASGDKTARVWDVATGECVAELRGHALPLASAAFSPDGELIVTASHDCAARVWDADTGVAVAVLKGHTGEVTFAAFSPDGAQIVTGSVDKAIRVWDVAAGACRVELREHNMGFRSAAFSADGTQILTASSGNSAWVWNAHVSVKRLHGHAHEVTSASFSADGTRILTASLDNTARVWDATTGAAVAELKGPGPNSARVERISAAFSPDGRRVLTVFQDGSARLWDAVTGAPGALLQGKVLSAQFSPDGAQVVTAEERMARVWDATSGASVAELNGPGRPITFAAFSPDGTSIITTARDGSALVRDVAAGSTRVVLKGPQEAGEWHAVFSPDGKRVVTAARGRDPRMWDAATGERLFSLASNFTVSRAAFSPDGTQVVTPLGIAARLWNATTGKQGAHLQGHASPINSIAFSPDGTRIVTASADATARVWDAATGVCTAELKGHTGEVASAAFSSDGSRIVTASFDKTVRIWDSVPYQRRRPAIEGARRAAAKVVPMVQSRLRSGESLDDIAATIIASDEISLEERTAALSEILRERERARRPAARTR